MVGTPRVVAAISLGLFRLSRRELRVKKIIDGKRYDTSTAEEIGCKENGYRPNDFNYECETLYRTKTGSYFLHGEGHAKSDYATVRGNERSWGQAIIPLSEAQAFEWASRNLKPEYFEQVFSHLITDA
jgi:hypothetical protein